jgi:hypothetical protein
VTFVNAKRFPHERSVVFLFIPGGCSSCSSRHTLSLHTLNYNRHQKKRRIKLASQLDEESEESTKVCKLRLSLEGAGDGALVAVNDKHEKLSDIMMQSVLPSLYFWRMSSK